MFTSFFTNLLFVLIVFTFINLVIKCYNIYINKKNNVVISSHNYTIKDYNKITHFLHFYNINGFYFYNATIFKLILNILNDYLRKYYKFDTRLCILVFQFNRKNNTCSLISNINEIDFNPYSKKDLNILINKLVVSGKKDILIVVKEI